MLPINYAAVLVAALVNFIIGFLMHGPIAGKLWMKLANITPTGNEKLSDMVPQMIKNLLVNIVFAYGLSVVYLYASTSSYGIPGLWTGLCVGFLVWFGFIVSGSSIEVIWMGKSYKLWLFELGCSLLSILAMGAIIAVW